MIPVPDEPRSPHSPVVPRIFVLLAVFVVLLVVLVLFAFLGSPKPRQGAAPRVSAKFLGYETNAAGMSVATFSINNLSSLPVQRLWYYEIQVRTGSNWVAQPTVRLPYARGPVILPNQSETWTVQAPSVQGKWRIWFPCVEPQSRLQQTSEAIRQKARQFGLPVKGTWIAYEVMSDEVSIIEQ